jgi:hypothetical protein
VCERRLGVGDGHPGPEARHRQRLPRRPQPAEIARPAAATTTCHHRWNRATRCRHHPIVITAGIARRAAVTTQVSSPGLPATDPVRQLTDPSRQSRAPHRLCGGRVSGRYRSDTGANVRGRRVSVKGATLTWPCCCGCGRWWGGSGARPGRRPRPARPRWGCGCGSRWPRESATARPARNSGQPGQDCTVGGIGESVQWGGEWRVATTRRDPPQGPARTI